MDMDFYLMFDGDGFEVVIHRPQDTFDPSTGAVQTSQQRVVLRAVEIPIEWRSRLTKPAFQEADCVVLIETQYGKMRPTNNDLLMRGNQPFKITSTEENWQHSGAVLATLKATRGDRRPDVKGVRA